MAQLVQQLKKNKIVNPINLIKKGYQKANQFFGLEGSPKDQALYYGTLFGSLFVALSLYAMVNF